MPIDPDQIRVDLLKVKRKIYLSYPEGSKERKEFILASKMTELTYLSKLLPVELANSVFQDYDKFLHKELTLITLNFGLGFLCSLGLLFLHLTHHAYIWWNLWSVPLILGGFHSIRHIKYILLERKTLRPFQQEFQALQDRITKLSDELKNLL